MWLIYQLILNYVKIGKKSIRLTLFYFFTPVLLNFILISLTAKFLQSAIFVKYFRVYL